MSIVPQDRTFYVGNRRYLEGEVLPPFIMLEIPTLNKKEIKIIEEELEKPKRRGRPRKREMF